MEENFLYWIYNTIGKSLDHILHSLHINGHIFNERWEHKVNPYYKIEFLKHFKNIENLNLSSENISINKDIIETSLNQCLIDMRKKTKMSDKKITLEMEKMYQLCNKGSEFLYNNKNLISDTQYAYFLGLIEKARKVLTDMWTQKADFSRTVIFDRDNIKSAHLTSGKITKALIKRPEVDFSSDNNKINIVGDIY